MVRVNDLVKVFSAEGRTIFNPERLIAVRSQDGALA